MWVLVSEEDRKNEIHWIIINAESNSKVKVLVSEEDRKWNTWIINVESNCNVKVLVSEEDRKNEILE